MKQPLLLLALAVVATGCADNPNFEEVDLDDAERRRQPVLVIGEIPTAPITVVSGANDVTLLHFRVGSRIDVYLSELSVRFAADSDGEVVRDIDADLDVRDLIYDCQVVRSNPNDVLIGSPETPDASGEIVWHDDIQVDTGVLHGRVDCNLAHLAFGSPVAIAAAIVASNGIEVEDANGNRVSQFRLDMNNSGVNENGDYHVIVNPSP